MTLRIVPRAFAPLLLLSAFGFASVGCQHTSKDPSEESDDDSKKEKKRKKKGKKSDKDGDKNGDKAAGTSEPQPEKKDAVLPAKIEVEPPAGIDEASKQKAKELAGKISYGRFPYDLIRDKANAKVWVHLAATGTDADVVVAALHAMDSAFTSWDRSTTATLADEDYARAVLMKIQDPNPKIQAAAIRAAEHSVSGETPHPKVVDALVDLAAHHPKPEGRHAAIGTLGRVRDLVENDVWFAPVLKALEAPEPWLVSQALNVMKFRMMMVKDKTTMKAKLVPLLAHTDPGVRGYAVDALAKLSGFDRSVAPEYAALLAPMLDDPHPFVKSEACEAMAFLRDKKSFHKIITMVDDTTANTYEIKGWTELDGTEGYQHHSASIWSTVGDAALSAIQNVSRDTSVKFELKVDYKTKEADLKKAAADAKTWYASVKGELGS